MHASAIWHILRAEIQDRPSAVPNLPKLPHPLRNVVGPSASSKVVCRSDMVPAGATRRFGRANDGLALTSRHQHLSVCFEGA